MAAIMDQDDEDIFDDEVVPGAFDLEPYKYHMQSRPLPDMCANNFTCGAPFDGQYISHIPSSFNPVTIDLTKEDDAVSLSEMELSPLVQPLSIPQDTESVESVQESSQEADVITVSEEPAALHIPLDSAVAQQLEMEEMLGGEAQPQEDITLDDGTDEAPNTEAPVDALQTEMEHVKKDLDLIRVCSV